jgi:ketosteroid isomerase-like protein
VTNADADKQELLRLNAEYRRCVVQRDVEGFDRLLAYDYFVIGPDGERVENKEDRLNYLKESDNVTEYFELSDIAVHVYGDSGIVHGIVTRGGTFEGRPITERGRDAYWYVKREGRWRMVSGQRSPIGWRPADTDSDEEELLELDADLLGAYVRHDPTIAEPILADDFLTLSDDGDEGSKASELELIEKNTGIEALEADEVEVRMYGEAASVTSLVMVKTREGRSRQVRLTHLYASWDGRWQAVMGQRAPVVRGWRRPRDDREEGETFGVHSGQRSMEGEPGDG